MKSNLFYNECLVSIETRLRAKRSGFDARQWQGGISFSSPSRSDRLWGRCAPYPKSVKLTFHLQLVPKIRCAELYLHSPMHLPSMVFN